VSEGLIDSMRPVVADLVPCVTGRDRAGFTLLLGRKTTKELHAIIALLAEAADEERLAKVTRRCRNCRAQLTRRPDGGYGGALGYCRSCYDRWWAAGKPPGGPPPPVPLSDRGAAVRAQATADREARIAEYGRLRDRRVPVAVAARRVGVSVETAYVYGAVLRKRQMAGVAA
jgi:hypothetical protein